MSDKLGKPRYDFDFEQFETGLYVLKAKETDTPKVDRTEEQEAALKGPKNDFNFLIHFQAEGGDFDGRSHFERFPHVAQGHIGLQKLQACMVKMEIMPPPPADGYDTSVFDGEKFRKAFKMMVPERKVIVIIRKKPGRTAGTEFSNIVAFYHINEMAQAREDFARKFKKARAGAELKAEATELPGANQANQAPNPEIPPADTW